MKDNFKIGDGMWHEKRKITVMLHYMDITNCYVAHQARAYPSFCSTKQLRVFIVPCMGHSIKFAGTQNLPGDRHSKGNVSCPNAKCNVPGQGTNRGHLIRRQAPLGHHKESS